MAYKGLPKTLIDVDLRYIDYHNTDLFGTRVVDGGLGWQSVFAVAIGGRYQATEKLTLSGGYLYNTNPIRSVTTLFNVQAPGIIQNTFTMGASYQLTENVVASLAWMHGFRNAIEGPILQIPGSTVRLDAQTDTLWAGVNIKFGGSKRKGPSSGSSTGGGDFVPSFPSAPPYAPVPSSTGDVPATEPAPATGSLARATAAPPAPSASESAPPLPQSPPTNE